MKKFSKKFSVATALVSLLGFCSFYNVNALAAETTAGVAVKSESVVVKPEHESAPLEKKKAVADQKEGTAVHKKDAAGQKEKEGVVDQNNNKKVAHIHKKTIAGSDCVSDRDVKRAQASELSPVRMVPRISVDGVVDAHYGYRNDESKFDVSRGATYDPAVGKAGGNIYDYSKDGNFYTDAVLNIRAENRNVKLGGLSYGANLQLKLSATPDSVYHSNGAYSRGASLFAGNNWGTITGGYQDGAEVLMRLDASSIATAGAGSDTNWYRGVNLEGVNGSEPFYLQSTLYSQSLYSGAIYSLSAGNKTHVLTPEEYNKLPFRMSYYSPNFMGLKFGVSYSPYYRDDLSISTTASRLSQSLAFDEAVPVNVFPADAEFAVAGSASGSASALDIAVGGIVPDGTDSTDLTKASVPAGKITGSVDISNFDRITVTPQGESAAFYTSDQMDEKIAAISGSSVPGSVDFVGPGYEDIISGGVSYERDFNFAKLKLSATGEVGKAKSIADLKQRYDSYAIAHDLSAFNLGAEVDYKNFKFAGSYANLNNSGLIKAVYKWNSATNSYGLDSTVTLPEKKDTYYWTVGAGYEYKDAYLSATYFSSNKQDGNILTDFAVGLQYDLALGNRSSFTPYVSWHYFTTESKNSPKSPTVDNKGNVVLAGVKFIF